MGSVDGRMRQGRRMANEDKGSGRRWRKIGFFIFIFIFLLKIGKKMKEEIKVLRFY